VEVARKKISNDDLNGFRPLVLVVDDEPVLLETLRVIFNANGLAVITAEDGREALEMAQLTPPDVLVSDVAMPGMSGLDLAVEVRDAFPNCEIILFSGEPATCDRVVEYQAKGYEFITLIKPVHPTHLLACMFELLSLSGWLVPEIAPRVTDPADVIFFSPVSPRAKERNRCRSIDKGPEALVISGSDPLLIAKA
jgi:DNA-binding response OmpR family regulator